MLTAACCPLHLRAWLLQGFNLAAMYEDLATLEVKLNKLLESKGRPVVTGMCKPVVPPTATAGTAAAH